jgi:hypothetical protein
MVSEIKKCQGIAQIPPADDPNDPPSRCKDRDSKLPEKIRSELESLNIPRAEASWGTFGQPVWDPTKFYAVSFVVESHEILLNAAFVTITYFVDPITDVGISGGWLPLDEKPAHWAYHKAGGSSLLN